MGEVRRQRLRARLAKFVADTKWRRVHGPTDVEAMVLDHTDVVYPVVRCITQLGCPAAELMRFLVDDVTETLPTWSRNIVACEEIERISDDERILLVRTVVRVPLVAAREDLFYVHRGEGRDGLSYEVSEVTEWPEVPIAAGALRSHMYFASKRIYPAEGGGCRYDVMWQYDPMGLLSKRLLRAVAIASVHNHMKDECVKLRARFGSLSRHRGAKCY